MATMKEIADLAGVSRGTVDRVLNHRGIVNIETQKKVLDIAKLLNYQPNKAGIALAAQKKKLKIGVLLFGIENPFFDEVLAGLHKKNEDLSIYGISLIEKQIPFELDTQLSAIQEMYEEGIQGLILSPYNDPSVKDKIDELWEHQVPCITVNTDIANSKRIAYVGSDYMRCGQTAAGLLNLLTSGEIKAGIITGSHGVLCHEDRIQGFMDKIHSEYSRIKVVEVIENKDDDYQSYEAVTTLLSKHPDLSALYFTAAGVYGGCRAIMNAALSTPPKVITFDAVPTTCEMIEQGVVSATICQQPEQQGACSIALMAEYLLTGTKPQQEYNYMDLTIKIKESL